MNNQHLSSRPALLPWAAIVLLICGCQILPPDYSGCIKDGRVYGKVRIAWNKPYEFYQRGYSYAEGECYDQAVEDFKSAISRHDGDQWGLREYGDWLVRYFPRRELGIVYYKLQRYTDAEAELEMSLSQTHSDKATYFLNQTRRAIVRSRHHRHPPPDIRLDRPQQPTWISEDPVVISGVILDDNYVSRCSVAGTPMPVDRFDRRLHFRKSLNLSKGRHHVRVEAENLAGITSHRELVIHVDREGPEIFLKPLSVPLEDKDGNRVVSGYLTDDAGVISLTINGSPVATDATHRFSHTVSSAHPLTIVTSDRLGNMTKLTLSLEKLVAAARAPLLAGLATRHDGLPYSTRAPRRKVNISFRGLLLEGSQPISIYQDKLPLQFIIENADRLETLDILQGGACLNNAGLQPTRLSTSISRYPGIQSAKLTIPIYLQMGENRIIFQWLDDRGILKIKTKCIIRKQPKHLNFDQRMALVFAKDAYRDSRDLLGSAFHNTLMSEIKRLDRFQWVSADSGPKSKKSWEIKKIDRIDEHDGVTITCEIRNSLQGRYNELVNVFHPNDLEDENQWAKLLASRILMEFPVFSGLVTERTGSDIRTDFGYGKSLFGRGLLIYRPPKGTDDARFLDRAEIKAVTIDSLKATLDSFNSSVERSDAVISE